MAFFPSKDVGGEPYTQQRVNLSKRAYEIVMSDIENFNIDRSSVSGEYNLSSFMCSVFMNSMDILDSFVSKKMQDCADSYYNFFNMNGVLMPGKNKEEYEKLRMKLVHKMCSAEKDRCTKHIRELVKRKFRSVRIYLNSELMTFVRNGNFSYEEKIFNGRFSGMMKAVIEEYCELAYCERERIVFKKKIEMLETVIKRDSRRSIRVVNNRNEIYDVVPFGISSDLNNTYNYLICLYKRSETKERFLPHGFRLSHIEPISHTEEDLRQAIPDEYLVTIDQWLDNYFDMYGSKKVTVKVRFTNEGIRLYSRIKYQRPLFIHKEGNVYTFECPELQAEHYFTRLPGEAEILEPESLRERLAQKFEKAAGVYSENYLTNKD